jgi:hypothetical protein
MNITHRIKQHVYTSYQVIWLVDWLIKGVFAVVPTDKICGRSLSSKIPIDMNIMFMKLFSFYTDEEYYF